MDGRSTSANPSPRAPALPQQVASALTDTASSSSSSISISISVLTTSSYVGSRTHVTGDGALPSEDNALSTDMAATAATAMNTTLYAIAKCSAAIFSIERIICCVNFLLNIGDRFVHVNEAIAYFDMLFAFIRFLSCS
jgi:hypothetical protein